MGKVVEGLRAVFITIVAHPGHMLPKRLSEDAHFNSLCTKRLQGDMATWIIILLRRYSKSKTREINLHY